MGMMRREVDMQNKQERLASLATEQAIEDSAALCEGTEVAIMGNVGVVRFGLPHMSSKEHEYGGTALLLSGEEYDEYLQELGVLTTSFDIPLNTLALALASKFVDQAIEAGLIWRTVH